MGLLVFALLTVRFSPNWITFYDTASEAKAAVVGTPAEQSIEDAIMSGYSTRRGLYVLNQARDLQFEVADPNHKILRWRLLMPALGHYLKLPSWATLGLAQLGCAVFIVTLMTIAAAGASGSVSSIDLMAFTVVGAATAPFFTSMGWLGYYDSWVAVALLAVAYARARLVVFVACLLAPWIDERFVIAVPMALLVRRIHFGDAGSSWWHWFRHEALIPLLVVAGYALLRFRLAGSAGSQTVADYLEHFVFSSKISLAHRLYGEWEGLRLGWLFVIAAVLGGTRANAAATQHQSQWLALAVIVTAVTGAMTALDVSRSVVLLVPLVPMGWSVCTRFAWWNRWHLTALPQRAPF